MPDVPGIPPRLEYLHDPEATAAADRTHAHVAPSTQDDLAVRSGPHERPEHVPTPAGRSHGLAEPPPSRDDIREAPHVPRRPHPRHRARVTASDVTELTVAVESAEPAMRAPVVDLPHETTLGSTEREPAAPAGGVRRRYDDGGGDERDKTQT